MSDKFDLERFVHAQRSVYDGVCAELRAGHKRGHWIWFIFPQVRGLGSSPMSQSFAIGSLGEAVAYLAHPVLGSRLRECTELVLAVPHLSAEQIFGSLDSMKFRSSMTLFAHAAGDSTEPFRRALDRFYGGKEDQTTLKLLRLSTAT